MNTMDLNAEEPTSVVAEGVIIGVDSITGIGMGVLTPDIPYGDGNIAIGYNADIAQSVSNSVVIGANARSDANNCIVLGYGARTTPCVRCGQEKEGLFVVGDVSVCCPCFRTAFVPEPNPFACYVCLKTTLGNAGVCMPELSGKRPMGLCHSCMRDQAIAHHAREQSAMHMQAMGVKSVEARVIALERELTKLMRDQSNS